MMMMRTMAHITPKMIIICGGGGGIIGGHPMGGGLRVPVGVTVGIWGPPSGVFGVTLRFGVTFLGGSGGPTGGFGDHTEIWGHVLGGFEGPNRGFGGQLLGGSWGSHGGLGIPWGFLGSH